VDTILTQLRGIISLGGPRFQRNSTVRRALSLLESSAGKVRDVTLRRSWLHGDFKSDNLILTTGRTIGLDLHLVYENVVIHDMTQFLSHLELTCYHPKGLRLLPFRERMIRAFNTGYAGCGLEAPLQPQVWDRLNGIIRAWAYNQDGSALKRIYLNPCFQRVASRLVSELQQAIS
jgi:Ser/Thr protein kinase RdoA (MazF antagonist)